MAEHPAVIRFGIVCDQVRREDNGKLLLVGTYGHDIVVPLPVQMVLTLIVAILTKAPIANHPLEIHTLHNGEVINSGRGNITIENVGNNLIVVPNIIVTATEQGTLEFKGKLGKDRWKDIVSLPLRTKT